MYNNRYDIEQVFDMLKKFYLSNFPHAVKIDVKDILESQYSYLNIKGNFTTSPGYPNQVGFKLNTPSPEPDSDNPYGNSLDKMRYDAEQFLQDSTQLKNLCEDIIVMQKWLITEGYLINGEQGRCVASSKLLSTRKIV